jgi:tRNA A37 threonylcarbamoyladenosine synthetase subunit TsaC/SUA5/YrdC
MSPTKEDRIIRSISGRNLPGVRFSDAIADALRREYGGTHAAVKTVVGLIGANERAVKNWFDAKNGPSGELLIALCRHSNQVLETVLLLAGRTDHIKAKKLVDAKHKIREMLALLDELDV